MNPPINELEIPNIYRDCILRTNRVLNRWVYEDKLPISKITDDDIRGLFLGNIRKYIFKGGWRDYRPFSKIIKIVQDGCTIGHVLYNDTDPHYWYCKSFMAALLETISKTDYKKLKDISAFAPNEEFADYKSTDTEFPDPNKINFDSIKNIIF